MRNQFRKPKKCELRHYFFLKQTILCKQICKRSEHICLQTQYEQLWEMNGEAPIKSSAVIILNTNKIQEKNCAEILYIRDCRLDFFQILNGV